MSCLDVVLCDEIVKLQYKFVACVVSEDIQATAKRMCSEIDANTQVLRKKGEENIREVFLKCQNCFAPGEDGTVDLEKIEKLNNLMHAYDLQCVSTNAMGLGPAIFQQMASEKDPRKLAQFMRTAVAFKIIDNGSAVAWLKQYGTAVGGVGVRVYGAASAP